MYTCLFEATRDSQTCFDPLLFHYPEDDQTFENIEHSFIFANALKVSPVTHSNVTEIMSYFPAGQWVSMNNFSDIIDVKCPNNTDCYGKYGEYWALKVSNKNDSVIHSHLKPGAFLAFQDNSEQKFSLTEEILQ